MSRTSCDVVDEAFVAAPPSAVWSAVLSENAHESSWWAPYWEAHPRGPTPLSVGSVIDYVVHPAGDRFRFIASRFTGRITDLEENRLACAELIEGDLRGIGESILEPADGGIRVRMHFRAESRSRNLLDRLLNMVFDLGKTHSYVARKGFVGLSRHLADTSAAPPGHAGGPRVTAAGESAPAEATAWGTAQESRDIGRRWLKGGTNAPRVDRLRDAIRLAGVIATGVLSRRPVRPLGDEARRPLPGDDLVSGKLPWTHGVTIRARPTEIWPWLVQMGCRRAGWYSYDGLDNDGVPSADRIVPELQRVEVGDICPGRRPQPTASSSGPSSSSGRSSSARRVSRSPGRWFSSRSTRRARASSLASGRGTSASPSD